MTSSTTASDIGTLVDLLQDAAQRRPDHPAVEAIPSGCLTFRALDALSDRVRDRLTLLGVGRGDRVGIYARKSIDAYSAMLGVMKCGAAYVPVDYAAPAWRSAFILADCGVKAVVLESSLTAAWSEEATRLGPLPSLIELQGAGDGSHLTAALDALDVTHGMAARAVTVRPRSDELAYILYTSGSTGKPKGVMLSHRNAVSYVDWCSAVFAPREDDRFSSHAPFHFDLSILDLYVPLKHGATVVLINADQGKEPTSLAALIAERRLTVWYSTPTILTMLAQYGKMNRHEYTSLRYVFFAGEVFPVKHLRAVKALLPSARFFNLYGPTETNVCTYHEIPAEVEPTRTEPYPIGRACEQFASRVVDEDGRDVERGAEGELIMAGPGVLLGYWNLPEKTAEAFFVDAGGTRWYRTGDLVTEDAHGVFTYVGRRDRMVKRRGYRIELGEIESGLYRHPDVKEAAVVAVKDAEGGVRIKAVLASSGAALSVIAMKQFCAQVLPAYMSPDVFTFVDALPRTSTDKVDYQCLMAS
ncbi:MAG: amino acid adenylation domain-containing protein [Gemmatimonadaceae bacterium]|nr:amino acid adenylation domain-containing protein [Gemmatimonadaceae bacterium]